MYRFSSVISTLKTKVDQSSNCVEGYWKTTDVKSKEEENEKKMETMPEVSLLTSKFRIHTSLDPQMSEIYPNWIIHWCSCLLRLRWGGKDVSREKTVFIFELYFFRHYWRTTWNRHNERKLENEEKQVRKINGGTRHEGFYFCTSVLMFHGFPFILTYFYMGPCDFSLYRFFYVYFYFFYSVF